MSKQELISIVIPTYNRASTIKSCVESIQNQTYQNIEIIIVDDCSTDNTYEVVKSIGDKRIKYFRLDKNMRACYARNFGIEHASGDYIAFQDSDDAWHSTKLEKEMHVLQSKNVDFVFCAMQKINKEGKVIGKFPSIKVSDDIDFYLQELKLNIISTQTILMKKKVYQTVKFDTSFRKYQDWDFAIRVSKEYKLAFVDDLLVDYCVGEDSISVMVSHFDALNHIYNKYLNEIKQYPSIEAYYLASFGDCFRHENRNKALAYYRQSLSINISFKTLIKYSLLCLGIKF